MSEAKFTKGSWSIEPHGNGFALYSDRSGVAHGLNLVNMIEPDKNFKANAHLIVAAPDMYETLNTIALVLEGKTEFSPDEISPEGIREALAKARGEHD
jgi:hypothetical protein